ncbi:hypothetical protein GA0070622_0904 [Micromonospora sediminicola]|uniref:Uncharacterized protein n=1 Tax=Micromonospora sediminicola TaxID=946078 RepID=A0A1A9B4F1_9ACTN|nr:hypothetical protein [Micromonospora sediminicola]SBT63936.1 hypothetical protein GA0070622_0904 [Micromonospora sediminicola]
MSAEQVAREHYRRRRRIVGRLVVVARQLWSRVDPDAIARSWAAQLGDLVPVTAAAQLAAAVTADSYLDAVLDAQGADPRARARVVPAALAGIASDGRPLPSLLYEPAITALTAIGAGVDVERALAGGYATLETAVRTQVADAGRAADATAMAARDVDTYIRMVVGKTCGRCVVLAGRRYRSAEAFDRHPCCDCVHVPAAEDTVDAIATNPRAWFDSLTPDEQDRQFTKAGAASIRLGADIGQVVNARRGAFGLAPAGARLTAAETRMLRGGRDRGQLATRDVYGRQVYTTTEGTTTRGVAGVRLGARERGVKDGGRYRQARTPRLMPESILTAAGDDRDEAIRLLRRFGYIR